MNKEDKEKMEMMTKVLQALLSLAQLSKEIKDNVEEFDNEDCDISSDEFKSLYKKVNNDPFMQEYIKFAKWAFGEDEEGTMADLPEVWAERHPDLPALPWLNHELACPKNNILRSFFFAAKHYFNKQK